MDVDQPAASGNLNSRSPSSIYANEESAAIAVLEQALTSARVNIPNLMPEIQKVSFAEEFGSDDTVLLELSEDLISEMENGARCVVRGSTEDFSVLCCTNRTMEMKLRETSSMVFLSPDLTTTRDASQTIRHFTERKITSMHDRYLELRPLVPRLERAKHKLEETPFTGLEYECEREKYPKYTFDNLLESAQSSELELSRYLLNVLYACEINGFWRLLSLTYIKSLICDVIAWLDENTLRWEDEVPMETTIAALENQEPESVMKTFFWPRFAVQSEAGMRLQSEKILRVFAASLLSATKEMTYDGFLEAMHAIIPERMVVTPACFEGLAYLDKSSNHIDYFPKSDLPFDPEKRFEAIFQERKLWRRDQLLPYIEDVVLDGQTMDRLLYKFAKTYVEDGTTYFVDINPF